MIDPSSSSATVTPDITINVNPYNESSPRDVKDLIARTYIKLYNKIGSKCVGIMHCNVIFENKSSQQLYIVAISGHGMNDLMQEFQFNNSTLGVLRDCFARESSVRVAPLDPIRSVYANALENVPLNTLSEQTLPYFVDTFIQRMMRKVRSLISILPVETNLDKHRCNLESLLRNTLWKHKIDSNPNLQSDDLDRVVGFYMCLLSPSCNVFIAKLKSLLLSNNGNENCLDYWLMEILTENSLLTLDEIKLRLNSTKEKAQFIEICKGLGVPTIATRLGMPGDCALRTLAVYFGVIENTPSIAIADFVAQCAEDNASADLLTFLSESQLSIGNICVNWYSVHLVEGKIGDFPLCAVCSVRFVPRLTELLKKVNLGKSNI